MPLRRISEYLANVSTLLVRAQRGNDPAGRADAVKQLAEIKDQVSAAVKVLEAEMRMGVNRKVELAAARAAVATLTQELTAIAADEPHRGQTLST